MKLNEKLFLMLFCKKSDYLSIQVKKIYLRSLANCSLLECVILLIYSKLAIRERLFTRIKIRRNSWKIKKPKILLWNIPIYRKNLKFRNKIIPLWKLNSTKSIWMTITAKLSYQLSSQECIALFRQSGNQSSL